MCDVCGVEWLHSDLVRDASGILRCPDDRAGRDAVTIAEIEAGMASKVDQAQSEPSYGRRADDNEGDEFYATPVSILGFDAVVAWHSADHGFWGTATSSRWTNSVKGSDGPPSPDKEGDVYSEFDSSIDGVLGVESSCPVLSGGGVAFNYQPMRAPYTKLVSAGDNPSLWVVGSMNAYDGLGNVGGLASVSSMPTSQTFASPQPKSMCIIQDVGAGHSAQASYQTAGSILVQTADKGEGVRLYSVRMEPDRLVFGIGTEDYVSETPSDDSAYEMGYLTLGGNSRTVGDGWNLQPSDGTIYESVLLNRIPTADEETALRAYFNRRWEAYL